MFFFCSDSSQTDMGDSRRRHRAALRPDAQSKERPSEHGVVVQGRRWNTSVQVSENSSNFIQFQRPSRKVVRFFFFLHFQIILASKPEGALAQPEFRNIFHSPSPRILSRTRGSYFDQFKRRTSSSSETFFSV